MRIGRILAYGLGITLGVGAGAWGLNACRKEKTLESPPAQLLAAKLHAANVGALIYIGATEAANTLNRKKQVALPKPKETRPNSDFFVRQGTTMGRSAAEQALANGTPNISSWMDQGYQLADMHSEKPADASDNRSLFYASLVAEFNRALLGMGAVTTNIIPDDGKPRAEDFMDDQMLVHLRGQAPNVPKGWKLRPGYASRAPETPPFADV